MSKLSEAARSFAHLRRPAFIEKRCKMQGLLKALLVANLMVCPAGQARTHSVSDVPKSPTVAKTAEQKGDQARCATGRDPAP